MASKKNQPKERVPITLRLDGDIHEALKRISAMEMRSLNTQIEYFLRKSVIAYESDTSYYDKTFAEIISRIQSGMMDVQSSGAE